jgi:hypothetical protein
MATETIDCEQFIQSVDFQYRQFVQDLHEYMLESGCKVTFEQKKSGFLASYKIGKPVRAIANFVFRKQGMLVRIYGENINKYEDFLNTLPKGMADSIKESSECKRLVHNTCSPKCSGYDFKIGDERYQKCRYGCFELLVTDENNPFIKSFVEFELNVRMTG